MPEQEEAGMTAVANTLDKQSLKIEWLGLAESVMLMYSQNVPIAEITRQLNAELEEEKSQYRISNSTVLRWIKLRPPEWLAEVKKLKQDILVQQIEEWEAQAIDVRKTVMQQLDDLVKDELETGQVTVRTKGGELYQRAMTLGEKKDLANIVLKKIEIQRSGEAMAGIGTKEGKRYGVDVTVKVDFITALRNKHKKKVNDEEDAVDVEYEDVK